MISKRTVRSLLDPPIAFDMDRIDRAMRLVSEGLTLRIPRRADGITVLPFFDGVLVQLH